MEILVDESIELDAIQQAAIALCTDGKRRLGAVSGPAGSGKTTIIRQVYDYYKNKGIRVALAAPTGKAARRIKEATGIDAKTIHKLLEYGKPGDRDENGKPIDPTFPQRHRKNPLDETIILVDEYAMVPYELHDNLLAALPSGGCVFAFGDVYQLPPIEKVRHNGPTPFEKLLKRPGDSITLERVYRQGEGSSILEAANRIRRGWIPERGDDGDEFLVKFTSTPLKELSHIVMHSGVDYKSIRNQIIIPQNKGRMGVTKANELLRNILNPNPVGELNLPRHKWAEKEPVSIAIGDKVVCTENSYDIRDYFERFSEWTDEQKPLFSSFIPTPENKQMLNGETGIVTQTYPDGSFEIDFGDRIVEIPSVYTEYWVEKDRLIDVYPARNIQLAYALTTHKCQGSEFDNVVYVLNSSMTYMQTRPNFYTAITRARKGVTVLTDNKSYAQSIRVVKR